MAVLEYGSLRVTLEVFERRGSLMVRYAMISLALVACLSQMVGCSQLWERATVSDIAIIPGTRVALYVKFKPLLVHEHGSVWKTPTWGWVEGVSWDTKDTTRKKLLCDIVIDGRRVFPDFFASDTEDTYYFSAQPLSWKREKRFHCIWEFHPEEMACRKLLHAPSRYLFACYDSFNVLSGRFPAMAIPGASNLRQRGDPPGIIASALTGKWYRFPYHMRSYRCFLLPTGSVVWIPSDIPPHSSFAEDSLYIDTDIVQENVERLWGITPDGASVFYSEEVMVGEATRSTLFAYHTEDRSVSKLTEWVGQKFKVGRASDRIGFLDVSQGKRRRGLASSYEIVVRGARIFDIEGRPLQRVDFDSPLNAAACDWDVDLMEMVYYDPRSHKIVIQKLGGDVIASFTP